MVMAWSLKELKWSKMIIHRWMRWTFLFLATTDHVTGPNFSLGDTVPLKISMDRRYDVKK